MINRKSSHPAAKARSLRWRIVGSILIVTARLAFADPAQTDHPFICQVTNAEQARTLADSLMEQAAYQRAGECYRVAGDYERANHAFMQASRASAMDGSRQLADDRDQAKAQWQRLQAALHRVHR